MEAEANENGERPTKKIAPRLPGEPGTVAANRREALARWLTASDNPYFARNTVNRVWHELFGQRLVKSLDDLEGLTESEPRVRIMQLLATDFTASGADLKRLLRVIVLSKPYQLASGGAASNAKASDRTGGTDAAALRQARLKVFAVFPVRSLAVDPLYQSIVRGTGHIGHDEVPVEGDDAELASQPPLAAGAQLASGGDKPGNKMAGRESMRSMPIDDRPDMPAEYTDWAGDLLGEQALTIQRSLTLLNGGYVQEASQAGAKLAVAMRGRYRTAQIEWLFLAMLSRQPSDEEMKAMLQIQREGKGQHGMEDVVWALLNSTEFNTNH